MSEASREHGVATTPDTAGSLARIVLKPIGSSLPLGFLALAGASLLLSSLQLGWVASSTTDQVAIATMVFAVPMQLVASVFGFLARDSVGGTGNSLLAGSWLLTGTILLTSPSGAPTRLLGVTGVFVAAALLVPGVAAALGKVLAALVMLGAAARFALTGAYELGAGRTWEQVSGWWGVGLCVLALYAALAFEIEDTCGRTVLPVLRHGLSRRTVHGGLPPDLSRLVSEAGVREQL